VTLELRGGMSSIPVDFDPREAFGKIRAPVKVTLKGYSYRSTISAMGGGMFIPLRRSHREAAGIEDGETVRVRVELDTQERTVEIPPDLRKALVAARAMPRWDQLSYTFQREHAEAVEGAKKPETRTRRIGKIVDSLAK
jgi:hypothetical protein